MRTRKRQIVNYYDNCTRCGKEFKLSSKNATRICPNCRSIVGRENAKAEENHRIQEASEEIKSLIGATIIGIEFQSSYYPESDELGTILLKTTQGTLVSLSAAGYEDHYITWKDADEKDLEEMHIKA